MAKIIKRLVIESKDRLYKIIEPNEELSSNNLFIFFIDLMNDYYYGCKCNESHFNDISSQEYENLKNEKVTNFLKDYFNCDSVEFV